MVAPLRGWIVRLGHAQRTIVLAGLLEILARLFLDINPPVSPNTICR